MWGYSGEFDKKSLFFVSKLAIATDDSKSPMAIVLYGGAKLTALPWGI